MKFKYELSLFSLLFILLFSPDIFAQQLNIENIWTKSLDNGYRPRNAITTIDGGILLCGNTTSMDNYYEYFDSLAWAVKLDTAGNVEWSHVLSSERKSAYSVVYQAADSTFYFTGFSRHFDTLTMRDHKDVLLTRLDAFGNLLLDTIFTQFAFQTGIDVKEDIDGNILLFTEGVRTTQALLEYANYDFEFYYKDPIWRVYNIDSQTNDIFVQQEFIGIYLDGLKKVFYADDGGFLLAGYGMGFYGDEPDGAAYPLIMKINNNLDKIWTKKPASWGSPYYFLTIDVLRARDGGFLFLQDENEEKNLDFEDDYEYPPDPFCWGPRTNYIIKADTGITMTHEFAFTIQNYCSRVHCFIEFPDSSIAVMGDMDGEFEVACDHNPELHQVTSRNVHHGMLKPVNLETGEFGETIPLGEDFYPRGYLELGNNEYIIYGYESFRYQIYSEDCYLFEVPPFKPMLYKFRWVP